MSAGIKKGQDDSRLNVLIVGKTGVGKSTLMAAMAVHKSMEIPEKVGVQEIRLGDGINMFEWQGLELKNNAQTLQELEAFLVARMEQRIHVAWLCIAEPSRRIEECERILYGLLCRYVDSVIVVITKAERDKDGKGEKFSHIIKHELGAKHVCRVRAIEIEDDDGNCKGIKGVDELWKYTRAIGDIEKTQEDSSVCVLSQDCIDVDFQDKENMNQEKIQDNFTEEFYQESSDVSDRMDGDERKRRAYGVVRSYVLGAGVVGAVQIPLVDVGGVAGVQMVMFSRIAKIYGYQPSKKELAALASAVMASAGIKIGLGRIMKMVPGAGMLIGGAIHASACASMTKIVGDAFVERVHDKWLKGAF